MKYRKLRIAWSVMCGILCLLLVALWVRSYTYWDRFEGTSFGNNGLVANSVRGIIFGGYGATDAPRPWTWFSFTDPRLSDGVVYADNGPNQRMVIGLNNLGPTGFDVGGQRAYMPHWFLVVAWLILAGTGWLPFHYSLRTLLITMTLIAVGLGLVVHASRN